MSRPIIEVSNLSKVYRLGEIGASSLREELGSLWHRITKRPTADEAARDFWALRDVSFEVQPGEVVGVIGRNGAGKSTLLKILSRITEPTSGRAVLRGRVASLLEVGTGFHPDLSGRDNIFLNGAILGMKRAEIRQKFDEIVTFAEVEQFIDTPVKRYSSGMYVRLAFAVAAHLEPEILIVDEVLAVGDAQFQKKCLGKMNEVAGRWGRTVLFVSHNTIAIRTLCQRTILLREGCVAYDGPSEAGVALYLQSMRQDTDIAAWATPEAAPGSDVIRIKRVLIRPDFDNSDSPLSMQSPFVVEIDFWAVGPRRRCHITLHLINDEGILVLTSGSPAAEHDTGLHKIVCNFPANLLNSGGYALKLLIVENENRVTYANDCIATFTLTDGAARDHACLGREPGVVQPSLRWEVAPIPDPQSTSTVSR